MGVKRLKAKEELRYRPKSSDCQYCGICKFFLNDKNFKGNVLCDKGAEHRCKMIGYGGRSYRINYHYKCDAFAYMERTAP